MTTKPAQPIMYEPNARLRQARRTNDNVKAANTMPKGLDPKVIVQFERPMPCVVILVHGVNDVGEAYRNQAAGLCAGLNRRLGRQDIVPGDWDVPQHCGTAQAYSYARRTADQGRNPIIPFYWGYRPVDKATYEADQKRYEDELKMRGTAAAEAPYDAYFRNRSSDPRSGMEHTDNFNNRLDALFCKNGGVFANATTNLVDMWGPGADIMGLARLLSNYAIPGVGNKGNYSHSIYENPHRIYMVHAAYRLANLIVSIRANEETAEDSINVVAHSQGTLITMLANFIVKNSKPSRRPADCVIFNHSPYSLVEPTIERMQTGYVQQTQSARVTTFANFCTLMANAKQAGPSPAAMDKRGIGRLATLQQKGFARDNHGKVYNYFCPNDQTVSLRSVKGIGWQGVPMQWMDKFGDAFRQRMFVGGRPVESECVVPFPKVSLPLAASTEVPDGEQRSLNGEALPPDLSYTFDLPDGCDVLGPSDHGVDEAARGAGVVRQSVADPRGAQPRYGVGGMSQAALREVEAKLRAQGHPWILIDAVVLTPGTLAITRYQTKDEMRAATQKKEASDSYHSAIVNSVATSERVTAFDLAIGRCKSYDFLKTDGGKFWQGLLRQADWRLSPVEADHLYYTQGILPPIIKRRMNKPPVIDGIKNETVMMAEGFKLDPGFNLEYEKVKAYRRLYNAASGVPTK